MSSRQNLMDSDTDKSYFGAHTSAAGVRCLTYIERSKHQYAGALPITAETYFLTFELLLPAGRAGWRPPVAPRNELRKWREMLGRHSLAPPSGSACGITQLPRAHYILARELLRNTDAQHGSLWSHRDLRCNIAHVTVQTCAILVSGSSHI